MNDLQICKHQFLIKRAHHISCLKDLFFSKFDSILKTCSIYFEQPSNMAKTISQSSFIIFSKKPDTYNITCKNDTTKLAIQTHGQEIINVENNCHAILSDIILQPISEFFVTKNLSFRYWTVSIKKIYRNYTDKDLQKLLAQAQKVSGIEKFIPTDLQVAKLLHSSLWKSFDNDNPTIILTTIATVIFLAFTTIATSLINPIPPRLFSNLFPLGGCRHVSHPVELDTEILLHQNFILSGLSVSIADFGFEGPGFDPQ